VKYRATLIPGDGIGPEVTDAAVRVIDAAGVKIEWESFDAGPKALELEGTPLPQRLIHSVKTHRIALKGPVTTAPFLRSAVDMIRHLGEDGAVQRLEKAISHTLTDGVKTPDLGGDASTAAFTDAVIARL
jgi:isocitrate/isopropylmalate dehydrogenase